MGSTALPKKITAQQKFEEVTDKSVLFSNDISQEVLIVISEARQDYRASAMIVQSKHVTKSLKIAIIVKMIILTLYIDFNLTKKILIYNNHKINYCNYFLPFDFAVC